MCVRACSLLFAAFIARARMWLLHSHQVFSNSGIEPGSYGFAGFYVVVTQLIGSLILNNLVVNVLGERYAAASEQLVKSKRKLHVANLKNHGR
jgi:hypothetical protein